MVRVLGFGTYDLDRHPRVGILLDGLREHGDDVIEVNVPMALDTAQRIELVRRPWLAYRLGAQLIRCWWRLVRQVRALRQETKDADLDAVVVGYLGHFDVLLARLLFPHSRVVLDQLVFAADTAADRGLARAGGPRARLLGALDRLAIAAADVVVVDTIENRALLPLEQRHKAVVAAVGAASAWFRAGADHVTAPPGEPLRVVFFGLYTPLQGTDVIAAALELLAGRDDIRVTMIGTGQRHAQARERAAANPHVNWVDWVQAGSLPEMVTTHDVCLGIFGTGAKARRVVANKVFQGAAAGCAIVTSDTAPQRRVLGSAALYTEPGDAAGLAAALRALADDRAEVARLAGRARSLALTSFSAASVVAPLRARLTTGGR